MTLQNGCKAEGQRSLWKQQLYWALNHLHTVTCSAILPWVVRSFEFKYILSKVIFVFCLSTVCLWVLFWSFHFKCQCKDCYGMHTHHTDLIVGRRWDRHLKIQMSEPKWEQTSKKHGWILVSLSSHRQNRIPKLITMLLNFLNKTDTFRWVTVKAGHYYLSSQLLNL